MYNEAGAAFLQHLTRQPQAASDIVVINQFADLGGLALTCSGGEPLLHPDIAPILRQACARDLQIAILSNLTLLDDPLIDLFREVNPCQIQVSLYSTNPREHDAITRVPGFHRRTVRAIELLLAANVQLQISCPVMTTNCKSYRSVIDWAAARGMKAQADPIMMARYDYTTDNLSQRLSEAQVPAIRITRIDPNCRLPHYDNDTEYAVPTDFHSPSEENACKTSREVYKWINRMAKN